MCFPSRTAIVKHTLAQVSATKFPTLLKDCMKLQKYMRIYSSNPRDHMGAVTLDDHCTSIKK